MRGKHGCELLVTWTQKEQWFLLMHLQGQREVPVSVSVPSILSLPFSRFHLLSSVATFGSHGIQQSCDHCSDGVYSTCWRAPSVLQKGAELSFVLGLWTYGSE